MTESETVEQTHQPVSGLVLVTGSTGYVGGRLIPRLLEAGYQVRAMGRDLGRLKSRHWADHQNITLVEGDVSKPESLLKAMEGCEALYYLVHSMNAENPDFANADRVAAENVKTAAFQAGIKRIIYLSGLGEDAPNLSKHLQSRAEVAKILKEGPVPITVLRAAMILGSGSASFEILRYLVDRLPIMITPKWVQTPCQPIAIRNVLYYLIGCLKNPETTGETLDIGGPEILAYEDLMQIYAEEAGLPKRKIIRVPFFSPKLSSYWIRFVTPVPSALAQPLAEGLKNPVICKDERILEIIPQELIECRVAIRRALDNVNKHKVETYWTDAGGVFLPEGNYPGDPGWAGGTFYQDKRTIILTGKIEDIWDPISRIGGTTGWYYGNWLWRIRGTLDQVVGGVGIRRGRRHPTELMPGDALDFWRVLGIQVPNYLRLLAEMKVSGAATLEFRLAQSGENEVKLTQIARFKPRGLLGILYWLSVSPFHQFVFNGMLKGIAKASKQEIIHWGELKSKGNTLAPPKESKG